MEIVQLLLWLFVFCQEFYVQCAVTEGGNCLLPDHNQCAILPDVCQDASLSHQLCPHVCGFCDVQTPSSFLAGSASFQWSSTSPPDGQVLDVCRGATVLIPWQYLLDAGDSVHDVTWLYDGHSQEIIAIMTHGQFLVMPAFSHRVQASGTAGLSLTGVQVGDSGNYTIEVQVLQSNTHVVMRRSVFLHVTDQLMTVDGSVHVTQSSEVILDPRTGQYSVQLQCGQFIFADNPPFQVEWVTPGGQVVNSSDYHDHHFTLTLPPPIKGGNYSCRIPPQHADLACLHGNAGHQGEATVVLDKVDAQLSILLKENQQLKDQQTALAHDNLQLTERLNRTENELSLSKTQLSQTLSHTQSDLSQTKTDLAQTKATLSQTQSDLAQTKTDLSQTKAALSHTQSDLSQAKADHDGRLNKLEDAARHQVAFHATSLQSGTPPDNTPLIFKDVVLNQGQAYNSTSGYFVTPYQGLYYFSATAGGEDSNQAAYFHLFVDGAQICESYNYFDGHSVEFSTLHAVLHLNVGQRVWIRSDGSTYDSADYTFFSGFLLSHDF